MPRKLFCVSGAKWSGAEVKVRSALSMLTVSLGRVSDRGLGGEAHGNSDRSVSLRDKRTAGLLKHARVRGWRVQPDQWPRSRSRIPPRLVRMNLKRNRSTTSSP